jgi:hypothetical protein
MARPTQAIEVLENWEDGYESDQSQHDVQATPFSSTAKLLEPSLADFYGKEKVTEKLDDGSASSKVYNRENHVPYVEEPQEEGFELSSTASSDSEDGNPVRRKDPFRHGLPPKCEFVRARRQRHRAEALAEFKLEQEAKTPHPATLRLQREDIQGLKALRLLGNSDMKSMVKNLEHSIEAAEVVRYLEWNRNQPKLTEVNQIEASRKAFFR